MPIDLFKLPVPLQYERVTESRSNCYRVWLVCAILAFGTLTIYWPAGHYDFVDYDDNDYVFKNPTVSAGLSWWGLVWSFVDQHASNWHPLTWLSYMLDCQLFGVNAGPTHMVNVLFHCANSVLLLFLLNSMTGAFWRSATVAVLFAWHPLHVESVAWISERKDVLSGFFFMLMLWMYVLHVKREILNFPANMEENHCPKPSSRRLLYHKLSLGFFVLGLLSKPMLVTAPLVLLLIDFWPLNRLADFRQRDAGMKIVKNLFSEKLPFFLLSVVVSVVTFFAQREGGAIASAPPVRFFDRVGEAVIGYLNYLEKLFWPRNLTFLYLRPDHLNVVMLLVAVLVLAAISILAAIHLRRQPFLIMGWLWFVTMLLPVSGLIEFGLQSIADRYTYLPSIGFFVMCVWAVAEVAESLFSPVARKILLTAVTTAVLVGCALLSRHQLGYWQNTETLMEHALKINPGNYVAHDNLGVYFSRIGRTREALEQYQLEHELDPASVQPPGTSSNSTSLEVPASRK